MHNSIKNGFTLVEIIVVLVIIGILATIIYAGSMEYQTRAVYNKAWHDISVIEGAVKTARVNTGGKLLVEITDNYWTARGCSTDFVSGGGNVEMLEPKYLPKTHACWQDYYTAVDRISEASGINLSTIKKGDYHGNPYIIDENEGEYPSVPCEEDFLTMVKPGTYRYYTQKAHINDPEDHNNFDPYGVSRYITLVKPADGC